MQTPLALSPALPSELLSYILTHNTSPTTLIICQPRASFLLSLQRCMPNTVQQQPPPPPPAQRSSSAPVDSEASETQRDTAVHGEEGGGSGGRGERGAQQKHPLLTATLHQIAISRSIALVFIPTLSHLRAYLSVFPPPPPRPDKSVPTDPAQLRFAKKGNTEPLVLVYGLVSLHRDTSDWSAQGLGNSLAGLVEAGRRGGRRLMLVEEREWGEDEDKKTGWDERVPMLNGSLRRAGMDSEEGGWSGRTVEVGRVLGRWCIFERGGWEDGDQ